jgi:hypothetical protein
VVDKPCNYFGGFRRTIGSGRFSSQAKIIWFSGTGGGTFHLVTPQASQFVLTNCSDPAHLSLKGSLPVLLLKTL